MKKDVKKEEKDLKRMEDAKANFEKLQRDISPFIKGRKYKRYVVEEQWCETGSVCK